MDDMTVLWNHYRYGKCWPSTGEFLQSLIYRKPTVKDIIDAFLPEQEPEPTYDNVPRSGSLYYMTELEPPAWFKRGVYEDKILMDDNPAHILKKARKAMTKMIPLDKKTLLRRALEMSQK